MGCGWGALVCHAAQHYGIEAQGVTLSQAQVDFAPQKIQALGLQDRAKVELMPGQKFRLSTRLILPDG